MPDVVGRARENFGREIIEQRLWRRLFRRVGWDGGSAGVLQQQGQSRNPAFRSLVQRANGGLRQVRAKRHDRSGFFRSQPQVLRVQHG